MKANVSFDRSPASRMCRVRTLVVLSLLHALATQAKGLEFYDECLQPQRTNATAIGHWKATRAAQRWGTNWPDDAVIPAPSPTTSISGPTGTPEAAYLMANEHWLALFDDGGRLRGLTTRRYGVEYIRSRGTRRFQPHSWVVGLGNPQTDPIDGPVIKELKGRDQPVPRVESTKTVDGEKTLAFIWRNVEGLNIEIRWRLDGNGHSKGIKVMPAVSGRHTAGLGIVWLRLYMPDLASGSGVDVLWPGRNSGIFLKDFAEHASIYEPYTKGTYPSSANAARFFGVLVGDRPKSPPVWGLYIGLENPTGGFIVRPVYRNNPRRDDHDSFIEYYPQNGSGVAGNSIQPSWEIVLEPLCADAGWVTLAKRYGRWSRKQSWARSEAVGRRTDGLRRAAIFGLIGVAAETTAFSDIRDPTGPGCRPCRKYTLDDWMAEELPGFPTAFYTNSWWWPGFDRGNPFVEPLSDTAATVVKAIGDYGSERLWLYGYVNPRYIDFSDLYQPGKAKCGTPPRHVAEPAWRTHGKTAAMLGFALKRPGHDPAHCGSNSTRGCRFFEFRTHQPSCLVLANPAELGWQAIVRIQEESIRSSGMQGIYWDTVGAASEGDWDPSRAHPIGINEAIPEAMRDLFSSIARRRDTEEWHFVREHGADFLNDLIPAVWVFSYQDVLANSYVNVPMLSAIYHDRMVYGGPPSATTEPINGLAAKWARFVTGGHTPGPIELWKLDKADFIDGPSDGLRETLLKRVADVRQRLVPYLSEGEFLGPLLFTNRNGVSSTMSINGWCEDSICSRVKRGADSPTVTSIQGAWWKGSDGSYALIYANADQAQPARAFVWVPRTFRNLDKHDCAYTEYPECPRTFALHDYGEELRLQARAGEYRIVRLGKHGD